VAALPSGFGLQSEGLRPAVRYAILLAKQPGLHKYRPACTGREANGRESYGVTGLGGGPEGLLLFLFTAVPPC
jgi:hypothetical protein